MSFNKLEDFTGRYGINIGQSIINAWNEHSSKPDSIDHERTRTQYELEKPGTKTFTLEKVDSTLTVTLEHPTSVPNSVPGSRSNVYNRNGEGKAKRKGKGKATAPHRAATPLTHKPQDQRELEEGEMDEFTDALMKELEVEGEKENVHLERLSMISSSRMQEEVKQKPPTALPVQQHKPKAKPSFKPKASKPIATPNASTAATSTTNGQTKKEKEMQMLIQEREGMMATEHPEEEELTFGQLSQPVVRRNPHSEPHHFELLTSPSPTPSIHHAQPTSSQVLQPPLTSQYDVMEEDDVVWDIDEDLFANEIEMVLEDDDEEEDEELEPVPMSIQSDIPTITSRPLSLTELAGGNNNTDSISDISGDDDDTLSDSSD
ncbi:hypothetical protein Clacol_000164 [Clathrus columnatus]|uniref:Uncharacterized protein n=1 Tax=Clathrus columnatus TaxID=1419009 RepID=A0AAV4ZXX9_9AGAM|nr:hypothetical protein Clacol_000164 [Clathrus columnatus]